MQESAQDFWNYSLSLYGKGEVSRNCLKLQDEFGGDANVLLLCCWAARNHGRELLPDEVRALVTSSGKWRTTIVKPIRMLRRQLKPGLKRVQWGQRAYETLKQAELESERAEQGLLIDTFMTFEARGGGDGDAASMALSSMERYLSILDCHGQPVALTAITEIAQAV